MKASSDTALYAVLTGDVVGSSKLSVPERQALLPAIEQSAKATQKAFPGLLPLPVDVFRGDSWQLLLKDPAKSLRAALFFRASLIAAEPAGQLVDTRVAIGIGAIQLPLAKRVSQGDGEAYRLSGRALDALKSPVCLALALPEGQPAEDIATVVTLLDALMRDWTARQAQAVVGALQGWTQEKITQLWSEKATQQTIGRHLDRAGWAAMEKGIAYVEVRLGA